MREIAWEAIILAQLFPALHPERVVEWFLSQFMPKEKTFRNNID